MNNKPSLQEFLQNNPGKGLNDYFNQYGELEESQHPVFPAPPPVERDHTFVDQPKSYIMGPNKEKAKIDILSIIASVLGIAAFFLPWMDMTKFKNVGDLTMVNGMDTYTVFSLFNLESFTDISNYTIYIIPLGAVLALIGELMRNWAVRTMGQILVVSFGLYWGYKLFYLFSHKEIHIEELALMDYIQYGFLMLLLAILLYLIDIGRTIFGNR